MTQKPVEEIAIEIEINEPQYTIFKPDIMRTAILIEDYLRMKDYYRESLSKALTQERAVAEEKYNKMLEEQREVQSGLVKDIQHYKYVAEDVEALQQKNEALENALKETCNSPDLAYKLFDLRKEILSLTQKLTEAEDRIKITKIAYEVGSDKLSKELTQKLKVATDSFEKIANGGLFNPAKYEHIAREALSKLREGEGK